MMGAPNIYVMLALWGWPAVAVALFLFMPPRRALIAGLVIGWLFLPVYGYPTPFLKWDKHLVVGLGALLGVGVFDTAKLFSFRLAIVDLPMAVWIVTPFIAAVANGFDAYDASAAVASHAVVWGIPYALGRMYYPDAVGMRGLAVWTFIAGLLYIPFCLAEVVISPQLNFLTYGYYQHEFTQVVRMGGYRPMVYLQHGIAVGLMMAGASLMGIWLWWTGSLKSLWGLPVWAPLGALLLTTLAVRSIGAVLLLMMGVGVLFTTRFARSYIVLLMALGLPLAYMGARSLGGWDGQGLLGFVEQGIERDRAASLQCRFDNERLLLDKAMQKPLFGWGPHGRNLVTRPDGTIESIPDGRWVIAIGSSGIVGLISFYGMLLLPVWMMRRRVAVRAWSHPMLAGVVGFAVLVTLTSVDFLLNDFPNPIFLLGLGALAGVASAPARADRAAPRAAAAAAAPGRQRPHYQPVAG